jgi:transcriptional regulator with XRE-family HTH domain
MVIDLEFTRRQVSLLMKQKGYKKTKLGEILGSYSDQKTKISKAERFLTGKQKSISLDEINLLSEFFGKPASFFLREVDGSQVMIGNTGGINIQNGDNSPIHIEDHALMELLRKIISLPSDKQEALKHLF